MEKLSEIIPVLSSSDIERDIVWYEKYTGFVLAFGDKEYAGIKRDHVEIHLQWHHKNEQDPVYGSPIKIFVHDIRPFYKEFLERGTINKGDLRENTPWKTTEFGFYDLNNNAIFFVENIKLD